MIVGQAGNGKVVLGLDKRNEEKNRGEEKEKRIETTHHGGGDRREITGILSLGRVESPCPDEDFPTRKRPL